MPFEIIRGDISRLRVDAIVNAANPSLLGGGGVDGAIHRAAGPELLEECRGLGGCAVGEAKLTKGYRLPAKYVIHTVGPVWEGGCRGEEKLLSSCYKNSLELALSHGLESVAFPLISAGVYGYPQAQAVGVAAEAIRQFLWDHDMTVYLVIYDGEEVLTDQRLYRDVLAYVRRREEKASNDEALSPIRRRLSLNKPDGMIPPAPREESAAPTDSALWREIKAAPREAFFSEAMPEDAKAAPSIRRPEKQASSLPEGDRLLESLRRELAGKTDEGFSQALLRLVDEKGLTDAQCYKRANVDRRLYSKIRSNPGYRPGKPMVFAFAVALELSLPETEELLQKAGFALSHSSRLDIILEYFITRRAYDIYRINEVLFQFDLPLLGSVMN